MRLHALRFTQPLEGAAFASLLARVSPERRGLIGRFRRWQDAHRALFAELLARLAAREALGREPRDCAFGEGPWGKPVLLDAPGYHFNLSHSGHWVLCAAGALPMGVDVEQVQPLDASLLGAVLTPPEAEAFRTCSEPSRPGHFFRYWTLKESYAKALGSGLQLGFQDVTLDLGPPIRVRRHGRPDPAAHFQAFNLDDTHPAALCTLGEAPPVALQQWEVEELVTASLQVVSPHAVTEQTELFKDHAPKAPALERLSARA